MISSAEQQHIIKLQDESLLSSLYVENILENILCAGFVEDLEATKALFEGSLDANVVLKILQSLAIECRCDFTEGVWNVELGGSQTKKKVKARSTKLTVCLAKAQIIYVRKYL